jgi:hypothetical protein
MSNPATPTRSWRIQFLLITLETKTETLGGWCCNCYAHFTLAEADCGVLSMDWVGSVVGPCAQ